MLRRARFSEGQETTGDAGEKARVGRLSDGQELLSQEGCCAGESSCC